MTEKRDFLSADFTHRKELLLTIYGVYAEWVRRFPLACRKGCDACCTQSVTMTSLEGEVILDGIRELNREAWLAEKLAQTTPIKSRPLMTTNHFAEACLKQLDVDSHMLCSWDFNPCIFLEDSSCSIYELRPFGCRSFGSFIRCRPEESAEIAPIHLTVNTVFCQIIEHLSSDNGYWSSMTDILQSLAEIEPRRSEKYLLPARPIPGLLLEPQEVRVVRSLLKRLAEHSSCASPFGDLIDNLMLI
jgi:Fe-S-cluster containining protein